MLVITYLDNRGEGLMVMVHGQRCEECGFGLSGLKDLTGLKQRQAALKTCEILKISQVEASLQVS